MEPNTLAAIYEAADKARGSAEQKLREADEAIKSGDSARAGELDTQAREHLKERKTLLERADVRKALDEATAKDEARALTQTKAQRGVEQAHTGDSLGAVGRAMADGVDLSHRISVAALKRRAELRARAEDAGVRTLSEIDAARAFEEFPQERLFVARLAELQGRKEPHLSDEQRTAWRAYQGVAERALSDSMVVANDAKGGDLAPDSWVMDIMSYMAYSGPLADFGLVRTFGQPGTNTLHYPRVTDAETKEAQAPGTDPAEGKDIDYTVFATDEITLTPRKRGVIVPTTEEMLASTNFRQWLTMEVGTLIGRKVNRELTLGGGTAATPDEAEGVVTGENTAGRFVAKGGVRAAALAEADVKALFKLMNLSYRRAPGTVAMAHSNTVLEFTFLRESTGGNLVFPRTADRGNVMLPHNIPLLENDALPDAQTAAANKAVVVLGNMPRYIVARGMGGGIRVGSEFFLRSQQWELGWHLWYDGKPGDVNAFRFIQGKA